MNTTLVRAEQILAPLNRELLDFAMQLQHGCWHNWNIEAAAHMVSFCKRIDTALTLIMHSDGYQDAPPTLTIQ